MALLIYHTLNKLLKKKKKHLEANFHSLTYLSIYW